ncbi:13862_t:CDS:10 [Funneliformis geosporum]|nr:13862_t:CDS:10 [Funneliformis geosporum]
MLDISKNELENELDLVDFINLETLNCSYNQLTNIDLSNCKKLKEIDCGYNKLTKLDLTGLNDLKEVICCNNYLESFDYSSLNPEKLTNLNITANKLSEQDLTVFNIQQGFSINRFVGSLEPLKNLTKLRNLNISNIDIDAHLEYLPTSIELVRCASQERSESKVKNIENLLKNSDEFIFSDDGYYKEKRYENIKEYIEKNYSDKENTKEIEFNSKTLQLSEKGELVISDYPNLEEIRAIGSENINNITKVTVANCSKLKEIDITNFVDNERLEITNCSDLEKLYCRNNKLSEIKGVNKGLNLTELNYLTNCEKLTEICYNCNSEQLERLSLGDNNFPKEKYDLSTFTKFKELKELGIAGMSKPSYFTGSLEPLKNLEKLETLHISGTNITHGLEYLSKSIKNFYCTPYRFESKVIDIHEELQSFAPLMPTDLKTKEFELTKKQSELISELSSNEEFDELFKKLSLSHNAMDKSLTKRDRGKKEITNSTNKALNKALKALEIEDQHEKSEEVPKMGKYYDNSTLTLIAMDSKIVLNQPSYVNTVYYRHGYNQETDKVELTLSQALFAIKNRKRTEPLDGIYSILGLLPYGKEVKVSYSNNSPEQALKEVMEIAIKNGYAEPLSWLGISNPQQDKEGSTSIMGSVGEVNSVFKDTDDEITNLTFITNQESGFEIEGGLYRKDIEVKPYDTESAPIKVSLLGTKESLENATENNILVVLYKEHYGTNKLLALLVKNNQTDIYHRLGLVELVDSEGIKFILGDQTWAKSTIIGSTPKYQTQIEIPPKGSN